MQWGEDEDGSTEPFLLTYVYDAMKMKSQFEHMRVSFPLDSSSSVLSFFLSFPFLFFYIMLFRPIS